MRSSAIALLQRNMSKFMQPFPNIGAQAFSDSFVISFRAKMEISWTNGVHQPCPPSTEMNE